MSRFYPVLIFLALGYSQYVTSMTLSVVTGANGYLGRVLVQELMTTTENDRILCLVRPHRVDEERKRYDNDSRIMIFPYDMLDGGTSLRQALEECQSHDDEAVVVYHVASVFGPTEDHVQTAHDNVKGSCDVVRVLADLKSSHQKSCQLVLTSSMAAVRGTGQIPSNGKYYTYEDWNTESKLGDNWGASYQWSKCESERLAKDLCQALGISMVSVCPSFVFGPPLEESNDKPSQSFSIELVGQWLRGESPVQSRLFVDVRDVARAHVLASRAPSGSRYLVTHERRIPSQDIAAWIRTVSATPEKVHFDANYKGGAIPIGEKEVDTEECLRMELGMELRPVKDTILEMAQKLQMSS